jgi:hypothetical protein
VNKDLLRTLQAETTGVIETITILGLNELSELLTTKLQESGQDVLVIPNSRAFDSLNQQIPVCQVIGVPQYAHSNLFARFCPSRIRREMHKPIPTTAS